MPEEDFLELESQQELLAVCGLNDEHLHLLRAAFDCTLIARGNNLRWQGTAEETAQLGRLLAELLFLYRQGVPLKAADVRYAISCVKKGDAAALHRMYAETIITNSRGRQIKARTLGQRRYLEAVRRNYVTLAIGPAGTGKTYLAVALAVAALKKKAAERIILTRPAVEAGEKLGFLPGDLQEKVDPYLRPLYDGLLEFLGNDTFQRYLARGVIEVAPLAYMRGRTLNDAFIILDEAQNTTYEQMKMFLTRFGTGSRMVITGDVTQIDLAVGGRSGLVAAARILAKVAGVAVINFSREDVLRHEIVEAIIGAYEQAEAAEARHAD